MRIRTHEARVSGEPGQLTFGQIEIWRVVPGHLRPRRGPRRKVLFVGTPSSPHRVEFDARTPSRVIMGRRCVPNGRAGKNGRVISGREFQSPYKDALAVSFDLVHCKCDALVVRDQSFRHRSQTTLRVSIVLLLPSACCVSPFVSVISPGSKLPSAGRRDDIGSGLRWCVRAAHALAHSTTKDLVDIGCCRVRWSEYGRNGLQTPKRRWSPWRACLKTSKSAFSGLLGCFFD